MPRKLACAYLQWRKVKEEPARAAWGQGENGWKLEMLTNLEQEMGRTGQKSERALVSWQDSLKLRMYQKVRIVLISKEREGDQAHPRS